MVIGFEATVLIWCPVKNGRRRFSLEFTVYTRACVYVSPSLGASLLWDAAFKQGEGGWGRVKLHTSKLLVPFSNPSPSWTAGARLNGNLCMGASRKRGNRFWPWSSDMRDNLLKCRFQLIYTMYGRCWNHSSDHSESNFCSQVLPVGEK